MVVVAEDPSLHGHGDERVDMVAEMSSCKHQQRQHEYTTELEQVPVIPVISPTTTEVMGRDVGCGN